MMFLALWFRGCLVWWSGDISFYWKY